MAKANLRCTKTRKLITLLLAMLMLCTIMPATAQAATVKKPVITSTKTKIKKNATVIKKGKKVALKAMCGKVNVTKKASWKSSNKKIVTVNKKGVIKARKKGTAYITAKYEGKFSKRLKVTVITKAKKPTPKPEKTAASGKLTFSSTPPTVIHTYGLRAMGVKYNGKDVTEQATYKSSNPDILSAVAGTLDAGKEEGTVKVTITYKGQSISCTVKVRKTTPNCAHYIWIAPADYWEDKSWWEGDPYPLCSGCHEQFVTIKEFEDHQNKMYRRGDFSHCGYIRMNPDAVCHNEGKGKYHSYLIKHCLECGMIVEDKYRPERVAKR